MFSMFKNLNKKNSIPSINDQLFKAAENNDYETFVELVGRGAKLDVVNNKGFNALHIACREGHLKLVQFILKQKPELINVVYYDFEGHGRIWSPLLLAIFAGNIHAPVLLSSERTEVIKLLLMNGAKISYTKKDVQKLPIEAALLIEEILKRRINHLLDEQENLNPSLFFKSPESQPKELNTVDYPNITNLSTQYKEMSDLIEFH